MPRSLILIAATALLSFAGPNGTAWSAEQWREVKNKQGIRVYTSPAPNNPIVRAKAIMRIAVPLETIADILDDNARHHEWVPYLLESKEIKSLSSSEQLEYNLFAAPWPASNRDFVYRVTARAEEEGRRWSFSLQSETTPLVPEKEGVIRGRVFQSTYRLTALEAELTEVELLFHADPRGWVPTWITNVIQEVWPYAVLKGLRQQALKVTAATQRP